MENKKVKFEIIRDYDGDVCGYKLGNYLLFKKYYWGNQYSWYVSNNTDYWKAYNDPKNQCVWSCKEGKQMLIALNMQ